MVFGLLAQREAAVAQSSMLPAELLVLVSDYAKEFADLPVALKLTIKKGRVICVDEESGVCFITDEFWTSESRLRSFPLCVPEACRVIDARAFQFIVGLAVNSARGWLFVLDAEAAFLYRICIGDGRWLGECKLQAPTALCFDAVKEAPIVALANRSVYFLTPDGGELMAKCFVLPGDFEANCMAVMSAHRRLFLGSRGSGFIYVVDLNDGALLKRIWTRAPARALALDNTRCLLFMLAASSIHVYKADDGALLRVERSDSVMDGIAYLERYDCLALCGDTVSFQATVLTDAEKDK